MHTLLNRQLDLFCPAHAKADLPGLYAAVDAAYAGYEDRLQAMKRRLRALQERAQQTEKLAAIGQLAAGVAHEINSPVAYVCSNLEMLGDYLERLMAMLQAYESSEAQLYAPQEAARLQARRVALDLDYLRHDLPRLMSESNAGMLRVRQIVQDMKACLHPDHSQQCSWADVNKGIDATLNLLANETKHRADVVKQYAALPPVLCRPSQINQVVLNLVVNAVHAITAPRGRITLRTGCDGNHVWFSVGDTGAGIAPGHLAHIFDAFFTTKPPGQGTGLGLSLARDIVHRHGGRIEVHSELGKGSTFRVALPIGRNGQHREAA